jgi:hypothetical protein
MYRDYDADPTTDGRWPTLNVLRISMLFLNSTCEKYYRSQIIELLRLADQSGRDGLKLMETRGWLQKHSTGRTVFYKMTDIGRVASMATLAQLQLSTLSASA